MAIVVTAGGVSSARAEGTPGPFGGSDNLVLVLGAIALVSPSEFGALIHDRRTDFVLGWSWQVPVTPSFRHRVVGGLSWAPGTAEHRFGQRLGYRFGTRDLLAGLGLAHDTSGMGWSPELGLKFLHGSGRNPQLDISLHVLVRADIAPAVDQFRGVTVFVGWNLL